mmetsp:Transcript_46016/g.109333  ORF Transcript_46016/g.109333 Transcript_46016/m.109333 type:complete len:290 (-) Transcript_46016:893-1762(-)
MHVALPLEQDLGEEEVHPVHPLAQLLVLGEELVVLLHDLLLGELLVLHLDLQLVVQRLLQHLLKVGRHQLQRHLVRGTRLRSFRVVQARKALEATVGRPDQAVRQLSQRCLVEFARHDHEGRKLLLRRCQHLLDISQFGFGLLQVFSQLFDQTTLPRLLELIRFRGLLPAQLVQFTQLLLRLLKFLRALLDLSALLGCKPAQELPRNDRVLHRAFDRDFGLLQHLNGFLLHIGIDGICCLAGLGGAQRPRKVRLLALNAGRLQLDVHGDLLLTHRVVDFVERFVHNHRV